MDVASGGQDQKEDMARSGEGNQANRYVPVVWDGAGGRETVARESVEGWTRVMGFIVVMMKMFERR
jgi:hypothetical protein